MKGGENRKKKVGIARDILKESQQGKYTTLVIGRRGLSGIKQFLFRSVSNKVVQLAKKVSVHLGPGWYIENQDIKLEPKDRVEVKGSLINFGGKPAIIAAEVTKGEQMLKLRDENGFPVWSGWRRR